MGLRGTEILSSEKIKNDFVLQFTKTPFNIKAVFQIPSLPSVSQMKCFYDKHFRPNLQIRDGLQFNPQCSQ